jgi:DNA uptake protein ComE-like DNA-binding protein
VSEEPGLNLHRIEERLAAAERARTQEAEELLTRMGAVEVLIDHLNGRVGEISGDRSAPAAAGASADLDLRVEGIEHVLDELGPLIGVPATIAALEQEVIALGDRLDLASRESEARAELVSREIEARISVAESNLSVRHGADWEGMQDVVTEVEHGSRDADRRLEARLAEQAAAAAEALEDLEGRITGSLEALAGRMGTATSASGSMAESMVSRLEMIERDIAEIEARFDGIAERIGERTGSSKTPRRTTQAERKPAPVPRPSPAPPPSEPAGPVNLNEANFEVLRSLGCSVTQTARILAARKVRGGFSSPDELSDVPGLPVEFRAELISRLTV